MSERGEATAACSLACGALVCLQRAPGGAVEASLLSRNGAELLCALPPLQLSGGADVLALALVRGADGR